MAERLVLMSQWIGLSEIPRARLRIIIRTLLRKYKYPPDGEKGAVDLVLKQAEALSEDLAA